ncbi:MAG TPA: molybdopterin-dependent oxidoreductase [Candidatus Saccharimonadia bacterium]|nr:molybdopterin-dependent oxidoreductase [Candidatus Saccharimonadia bacterium]
MSMRLPAMTFREWEGPLTSQLVLEPAKFGLGSMPATTQPAAVAKAICGFCSTGCGLKVHLDERGHAINLTPNTDYPVNLGMACPKGWEALTPLAAADRATTPLLLGKEVDWDTALQVFCLKFQAIMDKHGRESVAFISTGQIMCEEMAFLGSLAKFGMGMIHGDGNTRQCMATAVTAYKESFGFDAPPFTYADFEESDVLVFVGANPCIAHPIMWQRVLRNRRKPEIIVIDPRKTETAMAATQHLAILPKADLLLFYCLAHWLIAHGCLDEPFIQRHTTGFDEFRDFVRAYVPEKYLPSIGLSKEDFERFAMSILKGERVSFWWTMGVNQGHEATRTAQAIINIALMTGNIGRPGTGANSITGQCNAMGSRLFSNTTNLLGGHDFKNVEHRAKVADALDIPRDRIPDKPSLAYDQILAGVEEGRIRGLWMIATNAAHSWIQQKRFHELVKKLDFFVVQDMYATTESAQLAHLVLPAAGWGEKEGTFINSERRIGVSRKVSRAPGQALADFHIFRLIAEYWGCGALFRKWTSPEMVFESMKKVSRGQPCEMTGIEGYDMLEREGGVQWPLTQFQVSGSAFQVVKERRLFEDGKFFTADGRARFVFEQPKKLPEPVDAQFPFVLLTGRGTSAQWHTETRTGKSAILRKMHPAELLLEIHPQDAAMIGIHDGDAVSVTSRRATVSAKARCTATIQRGQVFLPMHDSKVNELTLNVVDPYSRQPSYKHCAVRVERST